MVDDVSDSSQSGSCPAASSSMNRPLNCSGGIGWDSGSSADGIGQGGGKRAAPQSMDTAFTSKRIRPSQASPLAAGLQLKLRCAQRMGAITDVTGDTTNAGCREVLLKPLGFKYVHALKVWRWDGNGNAAADPTPRLAELAQRDGIEVLIQHRLTLRPAQPPHLPAVLLTHSCLSSSDRVVGAPLLHSWSSSTTARKPSPRHRLQISCASACAHQRLTQRVPSLMCMHAMHSWIRALCVVQVHTDAQ